MGLRDRLHGDDTGGSGARRYQMREKLLSVGDDSWIDDESGNHVFKVDGKAARIRDTFVLENAAGDEVAKIQQRTLRVRDTMRIEMSGGSATVHKAVVGIRDRYKIDVDDGPGLKAHGNVADHEYEIERDGDTVATVSKRWFRVRETYGIEIAPGVDDALILAVTVCIDDMARG